MTHREAIEKLKALRNESIVDGFGMCKMDVDELDSILASADDLPCRWTWNDSDHEWKTTCGHGWTDEFYGRYPPEELGIYCCPNEGCGRRVEVVDGD